jgi:uncharacterized protein
MTGRARRIQRLLLAAAAIAAVGYVGAAGYLRLHERDLLYQPADRRVPAPDVSFALNETRVRYPSTGGVTLSAWIIPAAPDSTPTGWLLICHGNYGSIGYGQRPEFYASMRDLGLNLLAFDYRGFGESTGTPDERGLDDDAMASYEYLTQTRRIRPERLVIFGHSLGSGVAIELASHVRAEGLIVEGAYTSVVDRGQQLYPYLPVRLIATQRYPSLDRIPGITISKLFLHSPEDAVIPYAQGRRLFDAAQKPKRFVDVRGGHDDAFRVDKSVYYGAIGAFVRDLRERP